MHVSELNSTRKGQELRIGRIQRIGLREVWAHEALDFTTWLEDNVDVLAEAAGLQLSGVEREQAAGAFSVDLIAEDEDGRVVIENQLEKSDHDHLGKLLTYLVGIQARKAVWIVADPRPEHMAVIAWLNESSSADFYLLKLEAIRIGDSEPAPLLTQIAGPSEEARKVGQKKQQLDEQERLYYRFFEGLLDHAKLRTQLHANIRPSKGAFVGANAGIVGLTFYYVVLKSKARVELYIDTPHRDKNKRIFEELLRERVEIEGTFGAPLEWDTKKGRRAFRIAKTYDTGGIRDEDAWEAVHKELAGAMAKLESALKPRLSRL